MELYHDYYADATAQCYTDAEADAYNEYYAASLEHVGSRARAESNSTVTSPKERQREINNTHSLSTLPARACARGPDERAGAVDNLLITKIDAIYQYYKDVYDRPTVAPSVRRQIYDAVSLGAEPEMIIMAIEASARAPRPSWAYAHKVIINCLAEGVRTPEAYTARVERYKARRGAPMGALHGYGERTYTTQELEELFVDVMSRGKG